MHVTKGPARPVMQSPVEDTVPNQYSPKRNPILPIGPSIAYIPLTQNRFALVSVDHAEALAERNWQAKNTSHTFYAFSSVKIDGKQIYIPMHAAILGTLSGFVPDHIDGNGLNNLPHNLRFATRSQNSSHRVRSMRNNTSGYRGVTWNKRERRWKVNIVWQGKQRFVGSSKDAKEAAAMYEREARNLFGDFWRAA